MTSLTKMTIKPKVNENCRLTIDFDNMIHITAFLKYIGLRGTQNDPSKMMKKDVFDKSDYKKNSR